MGRVNKTTEGVFVNIVGTASKRSSYDQFITRNPEDFLNYVDQDLGFCVADYIKDYSNKVGKLKVDLQQLSDLEVIIMQMRAKANMKDNITLYTVRDVYIYARCPFFRVDKDTNEVRVLVDNVEFNLNPEGQLDLTMLSGNEEFMAKTYKKLSEVMDNEILSNTKDYKKIYKKNLEYSKI
jgi:hypothetical protein